MDHPKKRGYKVARLEDTVIDYRVWSQRELIERIHALENPRLTHMSDLKTEGLRLAQITKYCGTDILFIAKHALTETNFHSEVKVLNELISNNMSL